MYTFHFNNVLLVDVLILFMDVFYLQIFSTSSISKQIHRFSKVNNLLIFTIGPILEE